MFYRPEAEGVEELSPGKPWAKISCPFGAPRHLVPGYDRAVPPGQRTLDRRGI
jgi:hypothetical protein